MSPIMGSVNSQFGQQGPSSDGESLLQKTVLDRLTRRHPVWEANQSMWEEVSHVLYDGVRSNKALYLVQGSSEDALSFLERQKFGRFKGEMASILQRITGAVLSRPPKRSESLIRDFGAFIDNVDGQNTPLDCYVEDALFDALAFGADFAIIDIPVINNSTNTISEVTSKKFQREIESLRTQDINPVIHKFRRNQLVDWDTDSRGEPHWIRLHENKRIAITPESTPVQSEIYTEWDRQSWRRFAVIEDDSSKKRVIDLGSGDHNLGIVPIAMLWVHKSGEMQFESFIKYSYHNDIEQFQSDTDMRYSSYLHANPTILDGRESDPKRRWTTGPNALEKYNPKEGEDVKIIAARPEVFDTHRKNKEESRAAMRRTTGIDPLGGSDQPLSMIASGKARKASFAISEERFLRRDAKALERFERRIFEIAMRWKSNKTDLHPTIQLNKEIISYPQKFNLDANETQIKNWLETRNGINSDSYDREMQKQIVESMLGTITAEAKVTIFNEIEQNEIIKGMNNRQDEMDNEDPSEEPIEE